MRGGDETSGSAGYSLIELLLVLAVLSICLVVGSIFLASGLRNQEARGAAQTWQAATAWAQIGVLWQGGAIRLGYSGQSLALSHDFGISGGDLGSSAPPAPATANLARWRDGSGIAVTFAGNLASPDGGGSLFFKAVSGGYRISVRPESGLTTRSRVEAIP